MIKIKQVGDIDGVAAIEEWSGFRKYKFAKHKGKEEKFQMKLMNCKNEKETLFMLQKTLLMHTSYIQHA